MASTLQATFILINQTEIRVGSEWRSVFQFREPLGGLVARSLAGRSPISRGSKAINLLDKPEGSWPPSDFLLVIETER